VGDNVGDSQSSAAPTDLTKVVFIDDEPAILDGLRRSLFGRSDEWEMQFFEHPKAALAYLASVDSAVVVTDWKMPGMDGPTLVHHLKDPQHGTARQSFHIIMLTGNGGVEQAVAALDSGADDFLVKPCDMRELVARIQVGIRIISLERRLVEQASTDLLTGLSTRRHIEEIAIYEIERAQRGLQDLSVILADIDLFKGINDTHGHEGGDRVLEGISASLMSERRLFDSVARWGGEEFLLLCPGLSAEDSGAIAERVRRLAEATSVELPSGATVRATLSIGTASLPAGMEAGLASLVRTADDALYRAKAEGRNRCVGGGVPKGARLIAPAGGRVAS
jgi:two-component system cell cycle response regulator